MTSISDYVISCDKEQLKVLIERATARLKKIESAGRVALFGVFGGANGARWFSEKELAENYYIEAAKESLKDRFPEVTLERRVIPIEELSTYISDEEVKIFLAKKPEIIK